MVVLPTVARRREVVTERGAHPRHLVGHHGRADAGAVDDDARAGLPGGDGPGNGMREVGVVDRVGPVGAAVEHLDPLLLEAKGELLLQAVSTVIGTDGDHLRTGGGGRRVGCGRRRVV